MRYRPLGRTGQFVSEICLGTMTFHGGAGFWRNIGTVDQAGATALVARALEAGVNFIDTADVYSEGGSEILLGQALVDLKIRARGRDRRDESARPHRFWPQRRRAFPRAYSRPDRREPQAHET